jgi:hypothetical protein
MQHPLRSHTMGKRLEAMALDDRQADIDSLCDYPPAGLQR